jgi:hypothetical protein
MSHPNSVHVTSYLESAFPGWVIRSGEHVPRDSFWFTAEREGTRERHCTLVASEFLDDTPENQIEAVLSAWHLAAAMRRAGDDFVLVTNTGLRGRIPARDIR